MGDVHTPLEKMIDAYIRATERNGWDGIADYRSRPYQTCILMLLNKGARSKFDGQHLNLYDSLTALGSRQRLAS